MFEAAGNEPDFLLAFPRRRLFYEFAGIDAAGRKLPGVAIDRRTILAHHRHVALRIDRDQHDRRRVPHDLDLVLAAVGLSTGVDLNGKHATFEDGRHWTSPARVPLGYSLAFHHLTTRFGQAFRAARRARAAGRRAAG